MELMIVIAFIGACLFGIFLFFVLLPIIFCVVIFGAIGSLLGPIGTTIGVIGGFFIGLSAYR